MKKVMICLTLAAMIACAGCGASTTSPESPDVVASSQTNAVSSAAGWVDLLSNAVPFDDTMTLVDAEQAMTVYGISEEDGYTGDCALYISTMATPEEIAVFRADDNLSVQDLYNLAVSRIDRQKESYADYAPQEMPKLDSAVIEISGDFVVVCVCADNAMASSLITSNNA